MPSASSAAWSGLSAPPANSAKIVASLGPRRNLAHGGAAELDEILRLELAGLADPQHHQPGDGQPGRRDDVEGTAALAGEPVGRRRALHQVAGRRQRLAGRRAELHPVFAEHNENTFGRSRKRGECELTGIGHGSSFQKQRRLRRYGAVRPPCKARPAWPQPCAGGAPESRRQTGRRRSLRRLTVCCACSTGLPLRSHFVDPSRHTARGGSVRLIEGHAGRGVRRAGGSAEGGTAQADGVNRPVYFSHHIWGVPAGARQSDGRHLADPGVARRRPDDRPGPDHPGVHRHHQP